MGIVTGGIRGFFRIVWSCTTMGDGDGRREKEDGGRKTEDGRRKSEDERLETEDGRRGTEDGRWENSNFFEYFGSFLSLVGRKRILIFKIEREVEMSPTKIKKSR
jgi:hypothetical protein